jgi:restriction endonuclease S subunit
MTVTQKVFTEIFTVIPDSKSKIKSSSYLESGKYAVVDQGKELVAGFTDTSPTVDENLLPVIVFGDHTRAVKYVDFPFTAGADGTQILKPSSLTNPKYGFYLVLHAVGQIPSKGYARHFGELKKMKFQLPSLEKQREIVEKLDSAFAEITLLEANLKLSDDKANQLLHSLLWGEYLLEGIPVVPLEKLVDILDNQRIPINSTERLQRIGNVPYYGATGQVGTIDKAIFNETLILLGEDGAPFFDSIKPKAYEISGPAWVNNHAHVLRAKSEMVNQRYLLHFLNIFNYTGYVNGATRLKLTQGDMKRIPVPHPNMETQEKIVLKIDTAFEVIKNLTDQINQKKNLALSLRHSLLGKAFIREEAVA